MKTLALRFMLLAAVLMITQTVYAQYYRLPSPYKPAARNAPFGWYTSPAYSGGQWQTFDGGLYGTYGGYQPLGIRANGSTNYANPPYMGPSYYASPTFSLDSGTYSLGALKNLPSLLLRPPIASRGEIKIIHKAGGSVEVHFALNRKVYTIKPGETQRFNDDRDWVIAFGSGGSKGDLRYTLKAGTYRFVATDGGWDLKQTTEKTAPATKDAPSRLSSPE